ncbi:hypothetical protein [Flavobacterium crassostreae]|uniref:Lipoprotein n=1 Tax=Flavobacterium crassostreae TaxID=1763534 RepID=A0A1B9DKL6_9FLAO|nr:hypothetical protein [Flavobacterium crassostreae]OCB70227.1 hypothetical protein LPBF_12355 [Flavobacterium crassostreae]
MKKSFVTYLLLSSAIFVSCKNKESDAVPEAKLPQEPQTVTASCYKAIYQKDTLDLQLNQANNGTVSGDMVMAIENMPKKVGTLSGKFHGDTLFASYTFIQGGYQKKTYKNPMAFLKRADTLILGNGQIQTTMGASYFVKGSPIDFDTVKYNFTAVDCKSE